MKIFVNLLTISRIIFSFVLMFKANSISNLYFLLIIAILFLTDQLDGFLARKFKVQTSFGATIDTIADKVLCITLIIPLLKNYKLSVVMIIGELLIGLINFISYLHGKLIKVSIIGKVKMWVLSLSIIVGYVVSFGYLPVVIFDICSIITFVIQVGVIRNYIISLRKQKLSKLNDAKTLSKTISNLFSTEYYINRNSKG